MERTALAHHETEREVLRRLTTSSAATTETMLVALPDLIEAFHVAVCEAIIDASAAAGLRPRLWLTRDDPSRVAEAVGLCQASAGSSLLLVSDSDVHERFRRELPLITVTRRLTSAPAQVVVDEHSALREAVGRLGATGHGVIHYIDWEWRLTDIPLPLLYGEGSAPTLVPLAAGAAVETARWLTVTQPSACIVSDDFIALALLRRADEIGLRIPDDLQIVALSSVAGDSGPRRRRDLLTVDLRAAEAGELATRIGLDGRVGSEPVVLTPRWL